MVVAGMRVLSSASTPWGSEVTVAQSPLLSKLPPLDVRVHGGSSCRRAWHDVAFQEDLSKPSGNATARKQKAAQELQKQMNEREAEKQNQELQEHDTVENEIQQVDEMTKAQQQKQPNTSAPDAKEGKVEGDLAADVKRSEELARAARLWTERVGAMVEANRLEMLDLGRNQSAADAEGFLQRLPQSLGDANTDLQSLFQDRKTLLDFLRLGGAGDPASESHILKSITRHTAGASKGMNTMERLLRSAQALLETANRQAAMSHPLIRDSDVHMAPRDEEEGAATQEEEGQDTNLEDQEASADPETRDEAFFSQIKAQQALLDQGEPLGETAAQCQCDPQVKCGLQGRSFTWCRVGGGHCELLRRDGTTLHDLSGADHSLYKGKQTWPATGRRLERTGAVWDYCLPRPGPKLPGSAPRTAHGGVCAWRGDILGHYVDDPSYRDSAGHFDITKVPGGDRPGVEAMMQYFTDTSRYALCDSIPGSRPFAVCPVAADQEHPELGARGWLAAHTWDFCTDRNFRPEPVPGQDHSEQLPAPPAPALPEPEEPAPPEPELGDPSEAVQFPKPTVKYPTLQTGGATEQALSDQTSQNQLIRPLDQTSQDLSVKKLGAAHLCVVGFMWARLQRCLPQPQQHTARSAAYAAFLPDAGRTTFSKRAACHVCERLGDRRMQDESCAAGAEGVHEAMQCGNK